MSTIVTRAGKGSPLTNTEVDSNFTNLNTDKVETLASADGSIIITGTGASRDLSVSQNSNASVLLEQVRNSTGATLTRGTAVYISGATGQIPTVSKALATGDATSAQTLGLITSNLANNANGYVTIIGLVSDIDTSAYTDGAQLYLSPTTAGTLTATKPYAPQHLVYVAIVAHAHPTQGKLIVKVQNGYEMDELHNVSAQSPTNGQTLVYNTTTSLWEKNTVSLTAGVNGTLPVANGGTGQTTLQNAMDALAGAVTSGSYLRGNGADVVMSAIQVADVPTLNQNTTGTAANVTGTVAIANGGTGSTTATAALTALGAYPALNPSGYTSNTGTVTGVTGTAPVVSSGGTAPAISMAAASSGVNGYMTGTYATKLDGIATGATANTGTVTGVTGTAPVVSTGGTAPAISMAAASAGVNGYMTGAYATKLDGIATGATANTGTVTSVSGTGTVSGLTLSGTVTGAGSLTLGGAIGTLNQNTTGTAGGLTGTPNITVGTLNATDGNVQLYKSQTVDMSNTGVYSTSNYYPVTIGVPTDGCWIEIQNNLNSNVPSWSTHGSGFTLNLRWWTTGSGWGTTEIKRRVEQYHERFTNSTICGGITQMSHSSNETVWLRGGGIYFFKFSRNVTATAQSTTYTISGQSVTPTSSAQNTVWNSYSGAHVSYLDQAYVTNNVVLHAGNYNSYAPTLTGTGASGTWGISVTGNSATVGGFTPSASSGVGSRVVVADGNGYIFNNYFNSTDNAISSGVTAIMSKQGDNYYRSASAAAVATFISGQSMSISGNATNVTGTVAVANGGTGQTTGYKLFDATFTSNINANTDRTAGMYGSYASSATNTPTNSGILYNFMSGTGGAGDGGQFWQDYGTDNLYLRKRWGGGFGGWLTILSASNYNSYAMPIGSSATNSVDVRAPIFYDSNDTGYYVDPNSTSQSALRIRGGALFGPNTSWSTYLLVGGNGRDGYIDNATVASVCSTNGNLHIDAASGLGLYLNFYDGNLVNFGNGATATVSTINPDGSHRAQIFYDYNNTAYYVDPTSTSQLSTLLVVGDITVGQGQTSSNIYFYDSDEGTRRMHCNSNRIGFLNDGNGWGSYCGDGGEWYSDQSVRSPIFYDLNDTAYYIDPATFTNVYGGFQHSGAHGSSTIQNRLLAGNNGASTGEVQLRMWCSEPGITWDGAGFGYNVYNDGGANGFGKANASFGQAYMRMTSDGNWYFYNVTTGGTRYTTMQFVNTGYAIAFQSMRSPIFYDQDNTGYYVDPNSTSNLAEVQTNRTYGFSDIRSPIFYDYNNTAYYVDPTSTTALRTVGSWRADTSGWDGEFAGKIQYHDNSWYLQFSTDMRFRNSAGTNVVTFSSAGAIVASNNITAYSDERLKTNWRDMPENYVTRLAKVKVGIYDRTDQEDVTQVGVSAQSFQDLLPQAIMAAQDKMQTLSVSYGNAALASAVELAKEVVDLRNRVAQLESLISKLIGD